MGLRPAEDLENVTGRNATWMDRMDYILDIQCGYVYIYMVQRWPPPPPTTNGYGSTVSSGSSGPPPLWPVVVPPLWTVLVVCIYLSIYLSIYVCM